MTNLSQDQEEMRQSIQKNAMIWSVIVGVIIAGVAYWALGDQSTIIRLGGSTVGGIIVLVGVFKWRFAANSKSAQCEKCSDAFSISKTDHVETLKSSTDKETRETQEDNSTKVTTWTEEVFDVVDTYTCASCNDTKTKEYSVTRKKDEKTDVEPAPVKEKSKTVPAKTRAAPKAKSTGKTRSAPKAGAKKPAPKPKTRKAPVAAKKPNSPKE